MRGSLWRFVAVRIDGFVPPSLLVRSPEDARRARLAVGIGLLLVPVFALLVVIHLANGNVREAELNAVLGAFIGAAPFVLRHTGRLGLMVNGTLAIAFSIVVAAAVFARGAGITSATVALAEIPLFATLLGGIRVGTVWAVLSTLASAAIGVLGSLHLIAGRVPKENALYDDHASLVVITATLFVVGAMYEFRKDESLRHIADLEREKRRSDRERIEAKAEADLARAERLASMGRLAAAAAHEVNNPLSYVANNLEFLRRTLPSGGSETADALAEAQDGIERIRRIVSDLNVLSRGEEDVAEPVDAVSAVKTALKMAEMHTRKKAQVETEFADVPPILANEYRLVQALLNLIVNAAQAIPEGDVAKNRITARVTRAGDTVVIEIRDTGVGMASDVLGRVKEAFYTTKPLGEGTGLGLTLADGIIRRYGGRLELDSDQSGTVARVVFDASPVVKPESAPSSMPRVDEGPLPRLRVLVVDDEPLVARAFARILRDHQVTLESSGREAVARLLRGEVYDVVFCDVMMPDLSGMGVYEALARESPALAAQIVFMTGGTFTERASEFRDTVPNAFVDKPIDPRVVTRLIRARVAERAQAKAAAGAAAPELVATSSSPPP